MVVQLTTSSHAPLAIFKEKSALQFVKPGGCKMGQLHFAKTTRMNVLPSFVNSLVDLCLDMCPREIRVYTAYMSSARLLICKSAARQTIVLDDCD